MHAYYVPGIFVGVGDGSLHKMSRASVLMKLCEQRNRLRAAMNTYNRVMGQCGQGSLLQGVDMCAETQITGKDLSSDVVEREQRKQQMQRPRVRITTAVLVRAGRMVPDTARDAWRPDRVVPHRPW